MSQISPPIRILLLCAVALTASWMLFLKPKDEVAAPATAAPNVETDAPAVSTPGELVEAAQEAVDGSAAATEVAAGTAPGPAQAAAEPPATNLKDVPRPIAKAIRKDKAVVLLFWNRESPEDRAVRSALRDVNRWNGRVHVHAAPLGRISDYGRITRGADVEQSPTVVVVDPELRAETLVGFVDTRTIDQLVLDALRSTTGMFTSAYLREINSVCARHADAVWATPDPTTGAQAASYVATVRSKWTRFQRDFSAVKAPKRHRDLKRASVADQAAYAALLAEWTTFLGSSPSASRVVASGNRFSGREREIRRRHDRRMDARNVLSCGRQA